MLLSERSQFVKATYCMITTIWHFGKGKTVETVKKKKSQWLPEVKRERDQWLEHRGFFGQ